MLEKTKHFFVQFPVSILSLIIYYLWWCFVFTFNNKEYDNNAAGGMAILGLGIITIIFSISILVGFLISIIIKKEKRKTYIMFVLISSVPFLLLLSLIKK